MPPSVLSRGMRLSAGSCRCRCRRSRTRSRRPGARSMPEHPDPRPRGSGNSRRLKLSTRVRRRRRPGPRPHTLLSCPTSGCGSADTSERGKIYMQVAIDRTGSASGSEATRSVRDCRPAALESGAREPQTDKLDRLPQHHGRNIDSAADASDTPRRSVLASSKRRRSLVADEGVPPAEPLICAQDSLSPLDSGSASTGKAGRMGDDQGPR